MPYTIGAPVSRSLPLPPQPAAIYRREIQPRYLLVRSFPSPAIEQLWQDFVERVEFPDLYCTPHYFLEPHWKGKNPFAILALHHDRVAGVATGFAQGRLCRQSEAILLNGPPVRFLSHRQSEATA